MDFCSTRSNMALLACFSYANFQFFTSLAARLTVRTEVRIWKILFGLWAKNIWEKIILKIFICMREKFSKRESFSLTLENSWKCAFTFLSPRFFSPIVIFSRVRYHYRAHTVLLYYRSFWDNKNFFPPPQGDINESRLIVEKKIFTLHLLNYNHSSSFYFTWCFLVSV